MSATESETFKAFATTQGPFTLKGGNYTFDAVGTWTGGGSISLAMLAADGATYLPVSNLAGTVATLSANGIICGIFLPPGQYEFVVSGTVSSINAQVASVPS